MKQTHISVLLVSRNYVVKLKKPVDFGFLDYTTLAKREQAVRGEVNLNRRLCHDVYIGYGGVIEMDGVINFSGRHGTIVDHCVWMKRLPAERMLDQLVARNEATRATYQKLLETAQILVERDGGAILDATFRDPVQRQQAQTLAAALPTLWRVIDCQLAPELVRERLAQRAAKQDGLSDATWDIYLQQRAAHVATGDAERVARLELNTAGTIAASARTAADWLRQTVQPIA